MALKFPRTTHLFNLGSATADDLRLSIEEAAQMLSDCATRGLKMTAEEKVDGANLGLMWDANSSRVLAQNRSACFDPASPGSQFKQQFNQLDAWIKSHQCRLHDLLDGGKRIVYGEWMAFKHSIHYKELPDYLIVFDILDLNQGKYLSRAKFKKEIEHVNNLCDDGCSHEPPLFAIEEVKLEEPISLESLKNACLNTQSAYYDGLVEGLYLRWDEADWLQQRAKLVRPEFQQGMGVHWSSNRIPVVKNMVDFSKQYS